MKSSTIIGALCGVIFALGMAFARYNIDMDCKKLGVFSIGNTVYECKIK